MLSPDVRELTFDPGEGFTFVPGQWVSLRIPRGDTAEVIARSYSIASWPRPDGMIDLAVTRVEGGPGSAFLHDAQVGTTLPMTEAAGFFVMPEEITRPALFVGTGTGVAPLRSMLHAALSRGVRHPMALLFGTRTRQDILYAEEFTETAARAATFHFAPTLSRAGDDWAGRRGYVQSHVPELVAALGGACDVYVCGLNAMIREVRQVLKGDLGFTRERIHTERYD
jgi:ferredoxin-NADP reductase